MSTIDRLFGRRHFSVLLAGLILLTVTLSSGAALALPIPLPATIAYVVNNLSDNVSVIDTSNNTVIATIPVGDGPQRVAFSPDGSRAYVTNYLEGSVSVINTFTSTEIDVDGDATNGITRITVGAPVGQPGEAGPFGVDVSPDGTKVYVGNERSGNMSVIDTATNTVTATIPLGTLGFSPRTPAFTPDGTQVWVGVGAGTNQIKRFAFPSNALLGSTSGVIGEAARLDFLPDGSFAFAQNGCGGCGNLQKISTTSNSVVATLSYGTNGQFSMAIAPDGSFVYAGTGGGAGGQIREVNSSTMGTTRTLSVSASPTGIAISPDGGFLYITRSELTDVLVVRRSDLAQITTIAVGNGPSDIAITTLIDTTVPLVTLNPSANNCSLPGNAGWCRGAQTAGFSASDAASGVASPCSGASCNFIQSTTTNGSAVTIASGAVCDAAGNCNAGIDAGPFMIDSVAPSISIVSPANGGTYILNAAVASSYSCSDDTSDVDTCSGPVASSANFSTSPVGAHTFTVDATDVAGNPAQATNSYSVVYNFTGFFQPIDNMPTLNSVKAGSAIPVKFSLSGDQGLDIFEADYPKSQQMVCDSTATVDGIEETVTAGSSSLSYDASTDTYTYVWKTEKAWAGKCRQLVVKLNDGTVHTAYFNFTK